MGMIVVVSDRFYVSSLYEVRVNHWRKKKNTSEEKGKKKGKRTKGGSVCINAFVWNGWYAKEKRSSANIWMPMGGTWPKCASATITLYRQQRRRQRRRRILRQLGITRLPSRRACQPPCTSIKPVRLILTIRKLLLFPYSLSPYLFRFVYVCNAENFREMRKDNEFSTLLSPRRFARVFWQNQRCSVRFWNHVWRTYANAWI